VTSTTRRCISTSRRSCSSSGASGRATSIMRRRRSQPESRIDGRAQIGRFFATVPLDGHLDRIRIVPPGRRATDTSHTGEPVSGRPSQQRHYPSPARFARRVVHFSRPDSGAVLGAARRRRRAAEVRRVRVHFAARPRPGQQRVNYRSSGGPCSVPTKTGASVASQANRGTRASLRRPRARVSAQRHPAMPGLRAAWQA